MKPTKVVFIALAFIIFASANAQQTSRGEICQSIPGLSLEQQQKIDNLSLTHQKKMDELRLQFRSERNIQVATDLKTQMNTEMQKHYKGITALLSSEQKTWYDQNCSASYTGGTYPRNGLGKSGGVIGPGRGAGNRAGYSAGLGAGNRAGYSAGLGAGYSAGRGAGNRVGYGAGYSAGRGAGNRVGYSAGRGAGRGAGRARCMYVN